MLVNLSQPYGGDADQSQAYSDDPRDAYIGQLQAALQQSQAEVQGLRVENAELYRVGNALAEKIKSIQARLVEAAQRGQVIQATPAGSGQTAQAQRVEQRRESVGSSRAAEQIIDVGERRPEQDRPEQDRPEPDLTAKQREQLKQPWRFLDLWGDDGDLELDLGKR